ncbi:MAG: hypothetical protein HQK84_05805 [Nitrospinae bacterium]|nr:hypothetical protein [Nitrospinota bacterium]
MRSDKTTSENKLIGLTVSLIDERLIETFSFTSDHVSATIGTKDGAVCAPILSFDAVRPDSVRIYGEGFEILWEDIEIGPVCVSVRRNGVPVVYGINDPISEDMNVLNAKVCASAYLARHPIGHEDYEWVTVEPRRVEGGWYFDFEYRCLQNVPKEQWEVLGGAPGFIVSEKGTVREVGWDELPGLLENVGSKDGSNDTISGNESANGNGIRFHLYPMYFVYAIAGFLAIFWDWRALLGLAVIMAAFWIIAYFDDKRYQTTTNQFDNEDDVSPVGDIPHKFCPECNAPLFVVQPGITTAEEIIAFAKNSQCWQENPDAITGWMPPGRFCPNGCHAIHITPVPQFHTTGQKPEPKRIPCPVRITVADVLRDGSSYELVYESETGDSIKVLLSVITEGELRRIGYKKPCLYRLDPESHKELDLWDINWDEAGELASLLHPLLALNDSIKVGSAARAREMILYLKRRGKV